MVVMSIVAARPRPDSEKAVADECGFEPFKEARSKFDVRFYLVAIIFIIFDLEVASCSVAVTLGKLACSASGDGRLLRRPDRRFV